MIEVILSGGLGNQMFQYATGRALALRRDTSLLLDLRFLVTAESSRRFQLKAFNIEAEVREYAGVPDPHSLMRRLHRKLRESKRLCTYLELSFDPRVLHLPDDSILSGYFQSESYFRDYSHTIRREFNLERFLDSAVAPLHSRILSSDSVAVHVRRGDYLQHRVLNLPDLEEYYRGAFEAYEKLVVHPRFFIFSDDPDWCDGWEMAHRYDCNVVRLPEASGDALRAMALMSSCKHQIIANSTFSWWAAWLNSYPAKVVTMPALWLRELSTDDAGLDVPNWNQIPFVPSTSHGYQ